jgi:hypothetical protein
MWANFIDATFDNGASQENIPGEVGEPFCGLLSAATLYDNVRWLGNPAVQRRDLSERDAKQGYPGQN